MRNGWLMFKYSLLPALVRILVKSSTESGHAVQRRSEATLVGAL